VVPNDPNTPQANVALPVQPPVQSPALREALGSSDPHVALDALAERASEVLDRRGDNGELLSLVERDPNGRLQLASWIPSDVREVLKLEDGIVRYDFIFPRPE